ncbi:MAG: heme exporter protein CcmB [Bacteroidota bacterium]
MRKALGSSLFLRDHMSLIKESIQLLRKEFVLELRQRYAISGILLYVLSTVFIVYTSFIQVPGSVWNTLFWIIVLFASVNAIAKSFMQEAGNRQLYYYTLANPSAIILSKIVYNILLLLVLTFLSYGAFSLVAGNPVKNYQQFFIALFLGSIGFSITFTFVSAIASRARNSATLLAILGFPLVIPILMTLIKLSANSLGLMQDTAVWKDMLILLSIDAILISLAFVLFPFLWRD